MVRKFIGKVRRVFYGYSFDLSPFKRHWKDFQVRTLFVAGSILLLLSILVLLLSSFSLQAILAIPFLLAGMFLTTISMMKIQFLLDMDDDCVKEEPLSDQEVFDAEGDSDE